MKLDHKELSDICEEVREDSFRIIKKAKSGHLGGCSSSVELMVALYFGGALNYNPRNPFDEERDRVLVRGHLGPLRYKIFSLLGWLDEKELEHYRELGSKLQGHESMELVGGVDITPSGSLGMLLSYGTGAAIAAKKQNKSFKTYVFLGDGEEQEGNVSEAARHASNISLGNLICIIDRNRKQLSHPTEDVDGKADIKKIWEGYGWKVINLNDGHNLTEILSAYETAKIAGRPAMIIADTIKGKGIDGCLENYNGYHTISSCPEASLNAVLQKERKKTAQRMPLIEVKRPQPYSAKLNISISPPKEKTKLEDAKDSYLQELEKELAKQGKRFYVMTADLMQKPYVQKSNFSDSTSFIDVGIREQHLLACAHGISTTDPDSRIWIQSGDAFLYRCADQLDIIRQAKSKLVIIGDRAGLGGGKNGATHQSSCQPGMLLNMDGITFLEPADAEDLYNCFNWAVNDYSGPTYIRIHSDQIENLPHREPKNLSNYVVIEPKTKPDVTLIGSGLAMKYAVEAVNGLQERGISSRLINVVNMKSLDAEFAEKIEERVPALTIYNGNPFVLESAVSSALLKYDSNRPSYIASRGFVKGTSGSLTDLLKHYGLDKEGIVNFVKKELK